MGSGGGIDQSMSDIMQQAARWHVQLHSDEATAADRAAFEQWRGQKPEHAGAYQRVENFWRRFDGLEAAPAMAALQNAMQAVSRQSRRIKPMAGSVVLLVLTIAAGWGALQTTPARCLLAEYQSSVGQQRVVELADHSRLTLNTDTALDVDYSGGQRHVILYQGEVMVEVAKDPAHPFIVETRQGTARALGTQFVVKRTSDVTDVAVIESVVEACAAAGFFRRGEKSCVRLHAGEGTRLMPGDIPVPHSVDIDSVAGWQNSLLVVDNAPLAEVLAEIERYRQGRIHYDPDKIAGLRVSGVLPLNDTDRALESLTRLLPVRVDRYTALLVVVHPR